MSPPELACDKLRLGVPQVQVRGVEVVLVAQDQSCVEQPAAQRPLEEPLDTPAVPGAGATASSSSDSDGA